MAEETKTEAAEATGMAALGALTEEAAAPGAPEAPAAGRAEDRQSWPLVRNRPSQRCCCACMGQAWHRSDEDQWP